MNARVAVCCALLLVAVPAGEAQVVRHFVVRTAASSNNQTFTFEDESSLTPAKRLSTFDAGAYAELFPTTHFSLILGAEYQLRGVGTAVEYFSYQYLERVRRERKIGYIAVPLLLKYRAEGETVTPYVLSGPYLGCPVLDSYGESVSSDSWVVGATIGGGMEIHGLLPTTMMVDVRYMHDLTDTYQIWEDGVDVKGNAFDFGIGVAF